jgi:hypothetical protein
LETKALVDQIASEVVRRLAAREAATAPQAATDPGEDGADPDPAPAVTAPPQQTAPIAELMPPPPPAPAAPWRARANTGAARLGLTWREGDTLMPMPLIVASVDPGGPAERASIKPGDVIHAIALKFPAVFEGEHRKHPPGPPPLLVRVQRGSAKPFTVEVVLGAAPAEAVQRPGAVPAGQVDASAEDALGARLKAEAKPILTCDAYRYRAWWARQVGTADGATPAHMVVATVLTDYINKVTGTVWPKWETLGNRAQLSRASVARALCWMVEAGFLDHVVAGSRGRAAEYRVRLPDGQKWPAPERAIGVRG